MSPIGTFRWTLVVVAAVAFLSIGHAPAHSVTVTVPGDFPTLQAVVDSLRLPHPPRIDTVLVSEHFEPSPLNFVPVSDVTVIGVPDGFGERPTLPRMLVAVGQYRFQNLHITGPITHWADTEFRGCEIDSGAVAIGHGERPGHLRFSKCTIRGGLELVHYLTIDSSEVHGRIHLDYGTDGGIDLRNTTLTGPGDYGVAFHGSNECRIENCIIRGFGTGIAVDLDDSKLIVRKNVIEDCPGFALHVFKASSGSAEISDNQVRSCGLGIVVDHAPANVDGNVVLGSTSHGIVFNGTGGAIERNVVGRSGGRGLVVTPHEDSYDTIPILNNTSYGNAGSGLEVFYDGVRLNPTRIENNIAYGNGGHGLVAGGNLLLTFSCNDWFANDLGATSGIDPSATDLEIDPDFCSLSEDDAHLIAGSPLLDAVGCGLIGALGQGCTTTATLDARLAAERLLDGVHLRWQWAATTAVALERSEALAGPWETITPDLSQDANETAALDRDALPSREYWYRLRAFDRGGWQAVGEPVFVPEGTAMRFELTGVMPNPGTGPVRATFSLPRAASIDLDVFDVLGRHVASLTHGPHAAGVHTAEWLARGAAAPAAPGIYLVRYQHPGGQQARRFVLTR